MRGLHTTTLGFVASIVTLTAAHGGLADVASTYQDVARDVQKVESQVAGAVAGRDFDAFASHFAVPEAEAVKLKKWFGQLTTSWSGDTLERVEVVLPLLAVRHNKALVCQGHLDIYTKDGARTQHAWPPMAIERKDSRWVFVPEELESLDTPAGVAVRHAEFDVVPQLETNGLSATVTFTVENRTGKPLATIPIYIRYPLEIAEATVHGKPIEAEVRYGKINGQPQGLILARMSPALEPGGSVKLKFRYSVSYDFHDLGRKPVGFTEDRGFVLFEAGWYPHFDLDWTQFPYDMTITVPAGFRTLTSGDLLDERVADGRRVCSYRMEQAGAPYALWGRYKETPCKTGNVEMTIWTPEGGGIDPEPMAKLVGEAYDVFASLLPKPAIKRHRVVAVTRYGGYGATGNILLHDPTFSPEAIAQASTLDFVAHELSHSWVNSLAPPEGDPPSYMAEGLATYLGAKVVEKSRGKDASLPIWEEHCATYGRTARRAVAPNALVEELRMKDNPMFRAVAYTKGAFMLRELESLVGEKVVFDALGEVIRKNQGTHFTLKDFMGQVDRLAERDLSAFWKGYLGVADVADYVVESAGAGDSCERVCVRNYGLMMPTPVDVVAYDQDMQEIGRKRVVVTDAEGAVVAFGSGDRIAHVAVDPERRILQVERRNDVYPDSALLSGDADAVKSTIAKLFEVLRDGNFEVFAGMFTKNTNLLSEEMRLQVLSQLKQAMPLAISVSGPMRLIRTGEETAMVSVEVKVVLGGKERDLLGEFSLVKESDEWKLVVFRL